MKYSYHTKIEKRAIYGSLEAADFDSALAGVRRRWPKGTVQALFYRPANSSKLKTPGSTHPPSPDKSGTKGKSKPVK